MKAGIAILLAASAILAAGAAGAQEREPAERAPAPQVVVNVNAPAPAVAACAQPVAYRDCGCYPSYGTAVTVLDMPFQPGAMYFVNQPPVHVRHGRRR